MYLMGGKFVLLFELTFKCTNHIFYDLPDDLLLMQSLIKNVALHITLQERSYARSVAEHALFNTSPNIKELL